MRISAFSDFEATHAKQGYRHRYRVIPYRQWRFCTPLSKAKAKTKWVLRSITIILSVPHDKLLEAFASEALPSPLHHLLGKQLPLPRQWRWSAGFIAVQPHCSERSERCWLIINYIMARTKRVSLQRQQRPRKWKLLKEDLGIQATQIRVNPTEIDVQSIYFQLTKSLQTAWSASFHH